MIFQIDSVRDAAAIVETVMGLFVVANTWCAGLQFGILFQQQIWFILISFACACWTCGRWFGDSLWLLLLFTWQMFATARLNRFWCWNCCCFCDRLLCGGYGRWNNCHRICNQCSCFFVYRICFDRLLNVVCCFCGITFGTLWTLCCGWSRWLFSYCSNFLNNILAILAWYHWSTKWIFISSETYSTVGFFLTFFFSPSISTSRSTLDRSVNGVFERDRRVSRLFSSSLILNLSIYLKFNEKKYLDNADVDFLL